MSHLEHTHCTIVDNNRAVSVAKYSIRKPEMFLHFLTFPCIYENAGIGGYVEADRQAVTKVQAGGWVEIGRCTLHFVAETVHARVINYERMRARGRARSPSCRVQQRRIVPEDLVSL